MSKSAQRINLYLALGAFAFLAMIGLYTLEFSYFSNTRNFGLLAFYSLIVATVLVGIFLFFGYRLKFLNKDSIRLHVFFVVSFLVFAPFFGSYTNRKFSTARPFSEEYNYLGQKGYFVQTYGKKKGQPADTYWIYLRKNEKEYVFCTQGYMPQQIAGSGSDVRLVMRKGFWGFDFFDGRSWEFI